MEITAIDQSDATGWLAGASRTNEVYMTDVETMVRNVLRKAGGYTISRLNLLDHGNRQGFQIGNDWISPATILGYSSKLAKLKGHFSQTGFIHLQACDIGQNPSLLLLFGSIVGAPVVAGTGAHNPIYRFNFGDYVRCEPKRWLCDYTTGRP